MSDIDEPEKVKRKKIIGEMIHKRDMQDVFFVLSSQQGRRFYWRLMKECGVFKSGFTGNNTTFFNEGMREVGLRLLAEMNEVDAEAYLKCITESKKEEASNA